MNILLVYPKYPDTFWSFKHVLSFVSKKAVSPPLGLLTIGAMLPNEWNKRLVDVNVNDITDGDLKWADMVFISAMIVQKESARQIIGKCKMLGKKVVAGGPAFTTQYENFQGVDHFVLNEAEVTLPLFLKDLENGNLKYVYTSQIRPDITKTPPPLWNLINFKDYSSMVVQYSRGCPFNCEFCDIVIMNGRVPRTKTPNQFINECTLLYKSGWRGTLFIVDDNFIGNKMNVKKMLALLIKWQKGHNYPFKLMTESSINLADDDELMHMMSAANFSKVFLGIETPCVDSLKECGKMQNTARNIVDAVNAIQKNGMQVMGGFIVGFDNDEESIFETQIKFIQNIGVVIAMVGLLNAVPQTMLWHRLKAEGRLLNETTGENTDGSLNFMPKMGKENLLKGYKRIISDIYSPQQYYERINKFIKRYNPTVKGKIQKEEIRAFIKSMWRIGVMSKSRFLYWRLIVKTVFTKNKAFSEAIELAIYRHHFEKVTKSIIAT